MKILELFKRRSMSRGVLGLALGSGGTKGFAHIGALKAFEEAGIKFDYIAGTSIGSVIGSLYANGYNADKILELTKTIDFNEIKRDGILQFMPTSSENIEKAIEKVLGDIEFKDLKKPFSCVSVNLRTGKEVVFSSGKLCKILSSSCAVPPIFKPVIIDDMHLIDGAYINPIPSDVVRKMGAKYIIAIDLSNNSEYKTDSLKVLEVLMASVRIAMKSTTYKGRKECDVLLQPDLSNFKSTKTEGYEKMFEIGYESAKSKIPQILEKLKELKIKI